MKNGKEKEPLPSPESQAVKDRVKKFCEAKTLGFANREDAQFIIQSGYKIEKITVKSNKVIIPYFQIYFVPNGPLKWVYFVRI